MASPSSFHKQKFLLFLCASACSSYFTSDCTAAEAALHFSGCVSMQIARCIIWALHEMLKRKRLLLCQMNRRLAS